MTTDILLRDFHFKRFNKIERPKIQPRIPFKNNYGAQHHRLSFLSPTEYVRCNTVDFYLFDVKNFSLAEETLISCLGNLSLHNTISFTQR